MRVGHMYLSVLAKSFEDTHGLPKPRPDTVRLSRFTFSNKKTFSSMKPYILVSSQNMYSYDYYLKSIYLYRYKTTQQYFLEEKKKQMI